MTNEQIRRYALVALGMIAVVAIGLRMGGPDHKGAVTAAFAGLAAREEVSGTIRIETLVSSDAIGIRAPGVPAIRLPIGVAGPFRLSMPKGAAPLFAADLHLALEGGETTADAPSVDLVTDGHGALAIRPHRFPSSAQVGIDAQQLNDRWLRISAEEFALLTGAPATEAPEDGAPLAAPDARAFMASLAAAPLTAAVRIGSAEVGGRDTWHYRIGTDAATLVAFVEEATSQYLGRPLTEADRAAMDAALSSNDVVAEVWVGKEDGALAKFGFDLRPREGNDAPPVRVILEFGGDAAPSADRMPEDAVDLMQTFLQQLGAPARS
jgi:hypothetical protein